jgi:hypothetical protein
MHTMVKNEQLTAKHKLTWRSGLFPTLASCLSCVPEKDAIVAENETLALGVEVHCIQIARNAIQGFQALEALPAVRGLEHAAGATACIALLIGAESAQASLIRHMHKFCSLVHNNQVSPQD